MQFETAKLRLLIHKNSEENLRAKFFSILSIIIIVAMTISIIASFLTGNFDTASRTLFFEVLVIINLFIFTRRHNINFASYTLITLTSLAVLSSGDRNPVAKTAILWSIILMISAFKLLGHKLGAYYTGIYLFLMAFIHYVVAPSQGRTPYYTDKEINWAIVIMSIGGVMEYVLTKQSWNKDQIIKLASDKIVTQSTQLQNKLTATTDKAEKLEVDLEKEQQLLNEINKTKSQLDKSEDIYNTVVENMFEGVVIQDHTGKIVSSNKAAEEILEIKENELRSKNSKDPSWHAIHEDGSIYEGKNHPAMVALRTGKPVSGAIMGLRKESGRTVWLRINAVPMKSKHQEKLTVVATFQDITEEKEKTFELENMFENSPDLVGVANTDGYFERINSAFEKTLGYQSNSFIKKPFMDYVHPEDIQSTQNQIGSLSQGKKTLNFINRFKHKNGTYVWLEWNATPVGTKLYAIARDITSEKKRTDELERLNNAMIDRELLMVEMKAKIKALEKDKAS